MDAFFSKGETDDAQTRPASSNDLRVTGRYLDTLPQQLCSLLTTPDGVVVTLIDADLHKPGEAFLLTKDELVDLAGEAFHKRGEGEAHHPAQDPLFPTGYQDFLRAVEALSSDCGWQELRLVRLGDHILTRHGSHPRESHLYDRVKVHDLLNYAYQKREGLLGDPPSLEPFLTSTSHMAAYAHEIYAGYHGGGAVPDALGRDRYAHDFARLDSVLTSYGAIDRLIEEVDGGYLLGFMNPNGQQEVQTIERAQLGHFQPMNGVDSFNVGNDNTTLICSPLRAVGQYFDAKRARWIVAQDIGANTWLTDFVGLSDEMDNTSALARLQRAVTITIPPVNVLESKKRFTLLD